MNRIAAAGIVLLTITGCGQKADIPLPMIADLSLYLAQHRCPNGEPPMACSTMAAVPQRASDPMRWRRHDWPLPGYQVEDSVISDDGLYYITTFSFPPYGPFVVGNGDGGEIYVVDGKVARICCTQDGGKPGVFQRFLYWWSFDDQTVSGAWRIDPFQVGRARRETVRFPASGYGLTEIVADTIISEHYNLPGFGERLERFFLGAGWGRLLWEAWGPPGNLVPSDLPVRCPGSSWSAAPDIHPDWMLYDCRLSTNLIGADGSLSIDSYGWPPKGFIP